MNDFRYAFRALRQNPGFAFTAIVSIALGIGANATVFGISDGLLLRPLPVPHSSRVLTLSSRTPDGKLSTVSYADFEDFRDKSRCFQGLAAYELTPFGFSKTPKDQPRMEAGLLVSGNFFRTLEIEPPVGRAFRPEENKVPGRDAVVVLGHSFWKNEFAGDPSVIGRRVQLNGLDFTVIGVAPESFTGMDQYFRPNLFVPAMMAPALLQSNHDLLTDRANRAFTVKGRLKPGVSLYAANAEIALLAQSLEKSYPNTNLAFGTALRTEMQAHIDFAPGQLVVIVFLFAIVIVVLMIACANVANLMLNRGRARSREIAVRLAIGASRGQVIRALLTESLLIALGGSALGLLIAQAGVDFASSFQIPSDIPIELSFQLDGRVVGFALFASFLSALLFGLLPAFRSTKTDLVPALKAGQQDTGRQRLLGRNALVIVQVAGSLVLLVSATQLFRGFSYVLSHDPGFQIDRRLTMSFDPALIRYNAAQTDEFYKTLVDKVRALPGVRSTALTFAVPLSTNYAMETVAPENYAFRPGQKGDAVFVTSVDENFFKVFGIPLLRGRGFLPTDTASSPRVAVVNEAFVNHYKMQNPVGKRFRLGRGNGSWVEIAGVTKTGKYLSVIEPPINFIYFPIKQRPMSRLTLVAETYGDPTRLVKPLRKIVQSIAPGMPIFGVRTMSDFFEQRAVKACQFTNEIVGSVGLIGLALALVGLYAVVSYHVTRRTREIGIRMAIGADHFQVMKMILQQSAKLGITGVGAGVLVSLAANWALNAAVSLPALDPVLLVSVAVGLLLTTLLAAGIPARRAARIDPMQAMRED